jgi:lysylphosphatidylglycerol synthetase-like protein (DUF2156 family)
MPSTANDPESRPGRPPRAPRAPRRLRFGAIAVGAVVGVAGVPLCYLILRAFGVIVSDTGLLVCLVAPTAVLLLVCAIPRARGWALQAAVTSVLASVALVAFVAGGIALLSSVLSDPA